MKDEKRIGITVRLTPTQHDQLRKVAYEDRKTIQAIVMRGIRLAMEERKESRK